MTHSQPSAAQAKQNHFTGPRTEAGKKRSAANALKHGLCSRTFIVREDETEAFDQHVAGWHAATKPTNILEKEYTDQIILASWNLERIARLEAELLDETAGADPLLEESHTRKMRLLELYRSRAERTFNRALAELRKAQEEEVFRACRIPASVCATVSIVPSFARIRVLTARDEKSKRDLGGGDSPGMAAVLAHLKMKTAAAKNAPPPAAGR